MDQDLFKGLKFSVPVMFASVLLFIVHTILFYVLGFVAISFAEIGMNYVLLFVLFTAGQVVAATERQKGITALQKANKKSLWQRMILSLIFVVFTSSTAANPVLFSLHFILPYLVLTAVAMMQIKKLA